MVNMHKTIAESIIHLLTLLLQIFVHQLEKQEVITETEIETDPQIYGQLHEMMQQITMQKSAESKACFGIETSQSQTVPKGVQSGSVHG